MLSDDDSTEIDRRSWTIGILGPWYININIHQNVTTYLVLKFTSLLKILNEKYTQVNNIESSGSIPRNACVACKT